MAGYRKAHKHTWRLRVMPGYREWDLPESQSPMPGLLLRCACRAFVFVQQIDEESGGDAYHVLDVGRDRPFDAGDLEQVEAFVSAWRRGESKPLW